MGHGCRRSVGCAVGFLALTVWVKGGFVLHPAGVRVSFREEWRIFAWAIGLLVVRHAFVPSSGHPPSHRFGDARGAHGRRERCRSTTCCSNRCHTPRPPNSTLLLRAVAVICLFWGLTFRDDMPRRSGCSIAGVSMDIGDPLLSTWRLSWFAHQLPRDPAHLFDGNIFYPAKNTLAFSDAMLRAVADGRRRSCGWASTRCWPTTWCCSSGFALSGAAMFLLVRSLTQARQGRRSWPASCSRSCRTGTALRPSRAADGAVDAAVLVGVPPDRRGGRPARRPARRVSSWRSRRCRPSTTASSSRPT